MSISSIRKDYQLQSLSESDVKQDPIGQFGKWWDEAIASSIDEVNAMTLSTVTAEGKPSARVVLLKGFDERGFVFFTNYESNKGAQLTANPFASLVFFWKELERQVRIEGICEKVSEQESDDYFHSRPIGSQLGACASPQSRVIESRRVIENNLEKLQDQYRDMEIPRPGHWGGYRVVPQAIEFWQGRSSRLHDRIKYTKENQSWKIVRLAP
ncbi:MAG: pyridoxamine 5'-phosphate oxidase [Chitinophagia bacterium]|nr:pyridoxamine 5'-phosphate oxidase [Chitinophagia bacterium]